MNEPPHIAAPAGNNWDNSILEPLAELNLEVLDALARAPEGSSWRWRALGDDARARLAHCPFLLVDLGAARPQLWSGASRVGVHEARPVSALLAQRGPLATPLLRRVLLFAWHLARANRLAARITLGMDARCAALVAACRFADLEALAERRPEWIRPRWHDRPEVWQAWLGAAAEESPRSLENLRLWGLQMLAAEVLGRGA
ncbi:MAG TPA: hypothetical protein VMT83_13445 [Burkholderiaceae bacterium]|nr:hypothetical protein [Burkholderiaceae bacterium]